MIDQAVLESFVDELAVRVAARVSSQLSAIAASPATAEPWRLLPEEEAAGLLGRSASWLRTRARDGLIPFVRLDGGGRMYDPEDLRAFAEARKVGGDLLPGCCQPPGDPAWLSGNGAAGPVSDRRVS